MWSLYLDRMKKYEVPLLDFQENKISQLKHNIEMMIFDEKKVI